ncbi:MAG: manganese efflux pump MntP family protein [Verrucomicrobiota bacterium]
MSTLSILCIALGLAMDAGAVCVGAATTGFAANRRAVFRLVFHFGLFQFLMPVLGWAIGALIERRLHVINVWLAAGMLGCVGARMIWAAWHPSAQTQRNDPTRGATLVMLSLATSLDALVVGVSLALAGISVWYPSVLIGFITAGICFLAIRLGNRLRLVLARWAEVAGGVVLLLMAVRIILGGQLH